MPPEDSVTITNVNTDILADVLYMADLPHVAVEKRVLS